MTTPEKAELFKAVHREIVNAYRAVDQLSYFLREDGPAPDPTRAEALELVARDLKNSANELDELLS